MKANHIMNNEPTFIDDVVAGKASYDDLESHVDQWHDGNGFDVEIHEYLGLTKEQYFKWAGDDDGFKPEFDALVKELKTARKISGIEDANGN